MRREVEMHSRIITFKLFADQNLLLSMISLVGCGHVGQRFTQLVEKFKFRIIFGEAAGMGVAH